MGSGNTANLVNKVIWKMGCCYGANIVNNMVCTMGCGYAANIINSVVCKIGSSSGYTSMILTSLTVWSGIWAIALVKSLV